MANQWKPRGGAAMSARALFNLRNIIFAIGLFLCVRFLANRFRFAAPKHGILLTFRPTDELAQYSNVYFIETSEPFKSVASFEARHACAIESAARANPTKNIVVLLATWEDFTDSEQILVPDIVPLRRYQNVYFRRLALGQFAQDSGIEQILKEKQLYQRDNGAADLSELLRLAVLFRYGGIYLDLDVITLKPLDFENPNFFGIETVFFAGSSVMGMQRSGFGHNLAYSCLKDFQYFHKKGQVDNGSIVVTYKLLQACNVNFVQDILTEGCGDRLKVYPRHVFHPFDNNTVPLLFDPDRVLEVKDMIADSITVHLRHHHSQNIKSPKVAETGYNMIARKYCPNVYANNRENL
ncbi:lactosylceramide 4-alpha-galactosyltransferase-like [Anopheles aquasalis]|uniref:lactosylceramide 4-alpha-galactosyltransferase-like n=1 Tax=Anopheles aquasalis TaxID=42839 RepID=UPI00215A76CC|nr:lactosylceramide 4-alpha-galactosyltransferase-like [Anopheles aquasalis]